MCTWMDGWMEMEMGEGRGRACDATYQAFARIVAPRALMGVSAKRCQGQVPVENGTGVPPSET
jgi:hypothetical protein